MTSKPTSGPIQIQSLMTSQVHCIRPDMTIHEAITILLNHSVAGAPVVDDQNKVLTVASEGDLLKLAANGSLDKKISQCMDRLCRTENLITLRRTDAFATAYMKFLSHPVHRLIVIDEKGRLEGIVSRSNVLKIVLESKKA